MELPYSTVNKEVTSPPGVSWKETGWNGLRFRCPQEWDIIVSGNHHLLCEADFQPIIELRWHANRGNAANSTKSILRNLAKDSNLFPRQSIPASWQPLTSTYAIHLLLAEQEKSPRAALLTCRRCGTSLLFYFFAALPTSHPDIATLFSSLCCHRQQDEQTLWAVQDFRLSLPGRYQLTGYNFGAGLTRLSFQDGSLITHICRLAPASQRLQATDLAELLMVLGDVVLEKDTIQQTEHMASHSRHPPIYRQILDRMKRKLPFHEMVLRHHPDSDRLSGLFLFDKKPIPNSCPSSILDHYEIVSV